MENQLYTYSVTFPLRYYTYAINSEQRDSEYVMGLKQDIYWDVEHLVEEQIPDTNQLFRQMEPVHFHLSCEKDSENEKMPANFFIYFQLLSLLRRDIKTLMVPTS